MMPEPPPAGLLPRLDAPLWRRRKRPPFGPREGGRPVPAFTGGRTTGRPARVDLLTTGRYTLLVGNVRELALKIKVSGPVKLGEPMREHTSFRIGGPADLYVAPRTWEELAHTHALCCAHGIPVFLLGGGSNLLVSDHGIRGAVIDLTGIRGMERTGNTVSALCGTPISDLAEFAHSQGLSGLEFTYFLPGTVGGALWMNARCYDRSMSDVLIHADALRLKDTAPTPERFTCSPSQWGYKLSPFQTMEAAILGGCFRLSEGDPSRIRALMEGYRADRESKGHFLHPCAGSVFKNDRAFGAPTGKLIDEIGLKGTRRGGAQIAPYHGNIIINIGGAAAADVLALIELVENEVERKLGFRLAREVILAGEW